MPDLTPLLTDMLQQMRDVLSRDDLRAGLPLQPVVVTDVSPLLAEWVSMQSDYERQQKMIAELDADIARIQPWGDYPMQQIDQLAAQGLCLQFWSAPSWVLDMHHEWVEAYQLSLVSNNSKTSYFSIVVPIEAEINLPGAIRQQVPPCPLSTLIMLQTRAKDAARQGLTRMGDFALQYYLSIESALGLTNTLPPATKRARLKAHLKRIFSRK
ncbi:MAG: hypothetical protein Q4B58_04405 [Bacteroidales bacterium]|nr:hypothetical protein [Bacteroidales bacterium]